jgi:hypothetical protein
MEWIFRTCNDTKIAEAISDSLLLGKEQDVLDLLGGLWGTGAECIIFHQKNIVPEFFDLRTGIAGAILQKFVNYNVRLAIVGNFSNVTSKSLNAFIYESNCGNQIYFVDSVETALNKLA